MLLPPALAVVLAGPAAGGELRFLLEGEAGVTGDGNYGQIDQEQVVGTESVARAGGHLQLSYALERLDLALNYSPFYEQSLDDSELSGTSHRLDFGLVGDLTRLLTLAVRERLQSSPNLDLYQPVVTPETVVVARRGDQLTHSLDVSFNQEVSRRTSMMLGVTHALREYEVPELFDSESLGARLGASFNVAADRSIVASASLWRFDYENERESEVGTAGLAYERGLGRNGRFRIEGGAWSVDSTDQGVEQDTETGWRGGLQLSGGREPVRWAFGYSHDVSPGAGLGTTAEVDNVFLGLSTALGRQWTFGLDGTASRQDALGNSPAGEPGSGAADFDTEFVAGTARIAWSFAQAVRLTGGYSRVWQRAEAPPFEDLSYDRYFLGLAFRIYATGEDPREPDRLGRPIDEEPDAQ